MNPPDPDRTLDAAPAGPHGAADFPPQDAAAVPAPALADLARASMEAEWARGNFVPSEWYFEQAPALAADPAALDVVFLEFVLRQENGENPTADEFAVRFPALAAPLRRLLALDSALSSAPPDDTETSKAGVAPAAQQYIGRYLVLRPLAQGGQADVFVGLHPALGREVVIKHWRAGTGGAGAERLAAEGRLLATLDHPNLARIFDLDTAAGRPFVVMESLRGRNLHDLRKHAPVPPADAARWVATLARAADYAHARGILHLDIKPRNVVLDETGRPVLIDFGLARVEHGLAPDSPDTRVSGTLSYMAPEQARGESDRIGPAADVYGLGGVLYYLLAGRDPVSGGSSAELYAKACAGEWDRAALRKCGAPPPLILVCEKALDPNPAKRFPSAGAFAEALERAVRLRPWVPWAVAGLLLVLGLGVWLSLPGPKPIEPPPQGDALKHHSLDFTVGIYRFKKFHDTLPVPFQVGELARFKGTIPANHHGTLVLVNGAGKLKELDRFAPAAEEQRFTFPPPEAAGKAKVLEFEPPAGTRVALLAVSPSGPLTAEQLGLKPDEPWPQLPSDSVIKVVGGAAKVWAKGKDVVLGGAVEDPEGEVVDRLNRWLKSLPAGVTVEGWAFVVKDR
jgi:tRNA A-37 threonylcarbamoyl transferase component Bud32